MSGSGGGVVLVSVPVSEEVPVVVLEEVPEEGVVVVVFVPDQGAT